mmetsp:Transcript_75548/g.233744  ORF Transcript_75548/g.233744 Transcript_75548/m.233744 type:complete len:314 (-) Transcript_75548:107-1048(-)
MQGRTDAQPQVDQDVVDHRHAEPDREGRSLAGPRRRPVAEQELYDDEGDEGGQQEAPIEEGDRLPQGDALEVPPASVGVHQVAPDVPKLVRHRPVELALARQPVLQVDLPQHLFVDSLLDSLSDDLLNGLVVELVRDRLVCRPARDGGIELFFGRRLPSALLALQRLGGLPGDREVGEGILLRPLDHVLKRRVAERCVPHLDGQGRLGLAALVAKGRRGVQVQPDRGSCHSPLRRRRVRQLSCVPWRALPGGLRVQRVHVAPSADLQPALAANAPLLQADGRLAQGGLRLCRLTEERQQVRQHRSASGGRMDR